MSRARPMRNELPDLGYVMQQDPDRWPDYEVLRWIAIVYAAGRPLCERIRLAWHVLRG